jgi:3-hydroxyacyl-CoA dehydrogenase
MSSPTQYEVRDNIALILLNSAPVNGLGQPLRQAILDNYQRASADDTVQAIVIASTGKIFCGGADISEFGTELALSAPSLPEVVNTIEKSSKPVVAAINGMALGGGLELALAADYRIADANAKIGLPEVNLGLLPGAGGTQRMPRLVGAQQATKMVTSGAPVNASKPEVAGAIDRLNEAGENLLDGAISYAKELVETKAPVRDCAEISVDTSELPENFFADFRKSIARKTRGFFAPERNIQCIEAAIALPLNQGLEKESQLFSECMQTSQARAQQHLFFAERAATKIPGVDPKTKFRPIKSVAIIGAGTMGGGIAMNFANAGIPTKILELKEDALQRGLGVIRKNYEITAKKGKLTEAQVEERMQLLTGTLSYDDLADVDLVIEAVFEKMEIKKVVFKELDAVCKPGAILASNTSTLDVDEIAASTSRPQDVIGLHFFSPANVMRLLEIVRGEKTADDVIMTTIKTAQKIGKVPAVAGVCWGFIGNRVLEPYGREATRMVLEGASPAQIDKVLYEFGLAMGLPSMIDLAGIDVGYLTRQDRKEELYGRDPAYSGICDKLYELGRYGQKAGRGFYIYEGRDKSEDPEVIALAKDIAAEHSIEQRQISDQEILERTIFMLINEGAQVLEEGIAYRSSDIDLIYCNGYGFPGHRGGPMQYADEIGLPKVLDAINKYREQLGTYGETWFKPAPLLEKLVAEGKTFKQFSA